jgi:competence protein ComEA
MTKPNHPNTNGRDHVRERLASLACELAPDTRTTATNTDERIPVFTWPRTKDPDADVDIVDVELTEPDTRDGPPIEPPSSDPPAPNLLADTRAGPAGQLVERWLPGGQRTVDGARSLMRRHRGPVLATVVVALVAAIAAGVAMASARPETEAAPALPAAVSAMANSSSVPPSSAANTRIVVSVVGKVVNPGLVTLADGARVADAVESAGGILPGTDITALNMARKLADGEQIYVGIPVPPGAADPPPANPAGPAGPGSTDSTPKKSKKGKSSAQLAPGQKVNLNNASTNDLEALPGVGDATAQRIVTWRSQHGSFNSIDQLRDVGGIGDAKFAKLRDLVTV